MNGACSLVVAPSWDSIRKMKIANNRMSLFTVGWRCFEAPQFPPARGAAYNGSSSIATTLNPVNKVGNTQNSALPYSEQEHYHGTLLLLRETYQKDANTIHISFFYVTSTKRWSRATLPSQISWKLFISNHITSQVHIFYQMLASFPPFCQHSFCIDDNTNHRTRWMHSSNYQDVLWKADSHAWLRRKHAIYDEKHENLLKI